MKKRDLFALGLLALPVFLLAPGRGGKKTAPYLGRNFAHRGLHTQDKRVPENSLAAFALAAEAGYGMELDVQLSRDGQVVVFHDDDLRRVCGRDARVDELDLAELQTLSLCGTEDPPVFPGAEAGGRTSAFDRGAEKREAEPGTLPENPGPAPELSRGRLYREF